MCRYHSFLYITAAVSPKLFTTLTLLLAADRFEDDYIYGMYDTYSVIPVLNVVVLTAYHV